MKIRFMKSRKRGCKDNFRRVICTTYSRDPKTGAHIMLGVPGVVGECRLHSSYRIVYITED